MLIFIIISLFVLGFHNIIVYVLRRKDRSPLYFGIFCLLYSINTWVSSSYISAIFPHLSWLLLRKIDIITIMLSIPSFILFMHTFFPDEKNRLIQKGGQILTLLFILPAAVFSDDRLDRVFQFFYPVILMTTLYCIFIGIRAVRHRRSDAKSILLGISILSLAGINDILWALGIAHTAVFMPLATFVFTGIYSWLLSKRFANAFAGSERLAKELLENQRLRDEMEHRIQQEQHLYQTQRRLTGLLHTINDPLCAVNDIGTIEFCNRAFEELSGLSLVQLAGKPIDHYIDRNNKNYGITTVPLELEDDDLSVLLFKMTDTRSTENNAAVNLIEELNKNRKRIRSLETLLVNANPDMMRNNIHLSHDLEMIDTALEQMRQLLSPDLDLRQKKILGSKLITLTIQYWTECTGKTKADLARESGLWAIYINPDGWERTQTLDRYLSDKTFPKIPRWQKIIKTANFVLIRCLHASPLRIQLEKTLQELLLLS
ncbi:MAG: hypothetical protein A2293_07115 [Elusimicrobia bacterium RIFOXYB2_FULL_49_7]|nr:MAG: hypothetical protein A2293_07115 [Elusimicrobia bacterium RIFOXYB2_FULL_49_7]